jgi:TonB-linked SusC/RagA family outer membrane protein
MKRKIKFINWNLLSKMLFILCFSGSSVFLYAQGVKTVTGTITDPTGEAVIGARIDVKGSTEGTISDVNGKFALQAAPNATLVFSYVGYKKQEVAVGNRTSIEIILTEDTQLIDEVVVVGYGTQKKASLTGSVAAIKGDQLNALPTSNLTNALAGKLGGVSVAQTGGGRPGNTSEITIRARGTWNSTAPLYIIDGVVRDNRAFDALNSNEVEDISILKDAAAASIYGSRAANGVILVTTKRGKSGKATVNYAGSVGVSNFTLLPKMETVQQHIAFVNDYEREYNLNPNAGSPGTYSDQWGFYFYPTIYKNGVDASGGYINTNVFADDEIAYYKNHGGYDRLDEAWETPISTSHAVNVSGGTDKVTYFAGATYYNESGAFKVLNYDKYSVRSNLDAELAKGLKLSLSINTDISNDKGPNLDNLDNFFSGSDWVNNSGADNLGDRRMGKLFQGFRKATALMPGKLDGKYIGQGNKFDRDNPLAFADGASGSTTDQYWNMEYTAALQYDLPWVKGLSAKVLYNKYIRQYNQKKYQQPYEVYALRTEGTHQHIVTEEFTSAIPIQKGGLPALYERHDTNNYYQLNGFLNYNNTFGKHTVGAMIGFEQAESSGEWYSAKKSNYDLVNLPYFNFGPTDKINYDIDGKGWEDARLSYIGRFNYGFDNRYLLEFSFRRDASVKFAKEHRWGFFPSGSAAWRISEESFFKDNVSWMNNLKLRGSVGLTGNDAVGAWQYLDVAQVGSDNGSIIAGPYYGGSSLSYGAQIGAVGNPLITWEKSLNYDAGLETGILNNLFTLGFDYYFRHTYDILGSQTGELPDTFGATLADSNYGVVNSWGYDVELGFNKQINKDLALWGRGNFGFADNKIVEWAETGVPKHLSKIGKNWDRIYGYQADGIVQRMNNNGDGTYTITTSNGNTYVVPGSGYYSMRGSNYDIISTNKYAMRPGSVFIKDIGSQNGVDADGNPIYTKELNGKVDSNDADKDWIVNHFNPPYNYGLLLGGSWKGFSLDIFFQGLAGHQAIVATPNSAQYGWDQSNWGFWSEDHFSPVSNPNGAMPAPTNMGGLNMEGSGTFASTGAHSLWVRDASFVRLKNITLAYDFPKSMLSKAGISGAKVYVTGNNLALLYNPLKYYDSEVNGTTNQPDPTKDKPGGGITAYPLMRTFTVGLNVSF